MPPLTKSGGGNNKKFWVLKWKVTERVEVQMKVCFLGIGCPQSRRYRVSQQPAPSIFSVRLREQLEVRANLWHPATKQHDVNIQITPLRVIQRWEMRHSHWTTGIPSSIWLQFGSTRASSCRLHRVSHSCYEIAIENLTRPFPWLCATLSCHCPLIYGPAILPPNSSTAATHRQEQASEVAKYKKQIFHKRLMDGLSSTT